MIKIDLHTHTTMSDGTLTPSALVALAARLDIGALAITDHDTLAGLDEGRQAAEAFGVTFVPGIEISAAYQKQELHLLGLFIDKGARALTDAIDRWSAQRRERNERLLANLNAAGIGIRMDDLTAQVPERSDAASITRAHFAMAIIRTGRCSSMRKVYEQYLLPGAPTYVARNQTTADEAIAAIQSAGGRAVLAHPLRYGLGMPAVEATVAALAADGLSGLECFYSGHKPHEQEWLIKLAKKYRLSVSGGSDFHGGHDHVSLGTGYGSLFIPMSVYDALNSRKQSLTLADGHR